MYPATSLEEEMALLTGRQATLPPNIANAIAVRESVLDAGVFWVYANLLKRVNSVVPLYCCDAYDCRKRKFGGFSSPDKLGAYRVHMEGLKVLMDNCRHYSAPGPVIMVETASVNSAVAPNISAVLPTPPPPPPPSPSPPPSPEPGDWELEELDTEEDFRFSGEVFDTKLAARDAAIYANDSSDDSTGEVEPRMSAEVFDNDVDDWVAWKALMDAAAPSLTDTEAWNWQPDRIELQLVQPVLEEKSHSFFDPIAVRKPSRARKQVTKFTFTVTAKVKRAKAAKSARKLKRSKRA